MSRRVRRGARFGARPGHDAADDGTAAQTGGAPVTDTTSALGSLDVAIEARGSHRVHEGDLGGLRALREEHRVGRALVVCFERQTREIERGITVVPWRTFLDRLWGGDLGV